MCHIYCIDFNVFIMHFSCMYRGLLRKSYKLGKFGSELCNYYVNSKLCTIDCIMLNYALCLFWLLCLRLHRILRFLYYNVRECNSITLHPSVSQNKYGDKTVIYRAPHNPESKFMTLYFEFLTAYIPFA